MLFSPIDPLWVGLIVLVLFVLIYGLCYCLKLCVEAVKTGQKILTEQQESMSEEKGLKRKRKKKGDTVLSGGQKGQDNRAEAEEKGELASAPPPYASSAAIYGQTFCPEGITKPPAISTRETAKKIPFFPTTSIAFCCFALPYHFSSLSPRV